jgi:hypothetical protein
MGMGDIRWLPVSTLDRIDQAIDEIKRAMGDHVEAIVLVGAAVHPQRQDRAQLPELLIVVSEASVDDLHALAEEVHDSMTAGIRLRVITHEELHGSADVFTVEIAEYKANHVVLAGNDPFETVEWGDDEMRRSVEQGLRGVGRRVRNRVLSGLGTDGKRDNPQGALVQGLERFLMLARHALPLLGAEVPKLDAAVIDAVSKQVGVDASALRDTLKALRTGRAISDPLASVAELLDLVAPLTQRIDQLGSAR